MDICFGIRKARKSQDFRASKKTVRVAAGNTGGILEG